MLRTRPAALSACGALCRRFATAHASVERRIAAFLEEQARQARHEPPVQRGALARVTLAGGRTLSASRFETTPAVLLGQLEKEAKAHAKAANQSFNLFAPDVALALAIDAHADDALTAKDAADAASAVSAAAAPVTTASAGDGKDKDKSAVPVPSVLLARVNGELWELNRPLEADCTLEFVSSNAAAGRRTLWHSSAHILGQAVEQLFPGAWLSDGPALPQETGNLGGGFFYDVWLPGEQGVNPTHLQALNAACADIIKARQPMERLVVTRAFAERLFADNPLKLHILRRQIPAATTHVTLYRCGALVDLCRGPHVAHTGVPKVLETLRAGASQFTPHADDASLWPNFSASNAIQPLQRITGISFVDKVELRHWRQRTDAAAARDHRLIGAAQKLFFFHKWAPGSAMLLPHGVRIQQRLADLIRAQYRQRGYHEVATPLMYSHRLWQQSGHWQHYRDDMFLVTDARHVQNDAAVAHMRTLLRAPAPADATSTTASTASLVSSSSSPSLAPASALAATPTPAGVDDDLMCLKPMNCPGHCLIFASETRSYRDLPLRFADFSPLHRNEASGALSGLTRVRRFEQDDAHIFCTPEQIQDEIANCLDFVHCVYQVLGMSFSVRVSTRPTEHLGSAAQWDQAEAALQAALGRFSASLTQRGLPDVRWEMNPGDGAFYGPKLDIAVRDALGRQHQCATVQLDFQLPQRFQLKYTGADGQAHAPVMVHRAILGSFQRLLAVLIEHTGGRWPYWLSPKQVAVLPVSEKHAAAAAAVCARLDRAGVYADCLASNATLPKRVRDAQVEQYNFIAVVGDDEIAGDTVAVRTRDGKQMPPESVAAFEQRLRDMQQRRL